MRRSILILLLAAPLIVGCQTRYDLVIQNGRVIDPESGLDGVRSIGVTGTRIAAVSEGSLAGKRVLDAAGHVVAPGFIDLHQHGQAPENYAAHARDGITTSLELEIGVENIDAWYAERAGGQIVNYGASISHPYSRQIAMTGSNPGLSGRSAGAAGYRGRDPKNRPTDRQGTRSGRRRSRFRRCIQPGRH